MAARTYKRDSNGRFASGSGGGSAGKTATKKPATKKPATKKPAAGKPAASKPASNGRRGPRGGKVGTKAQQAKAKREQQARSKQFASKKQATSAQKAWKAASRGARMSEKGAARKVVQAAAKKASEARAKVVSGGGRKGSKTSVRTQSSSNAKPLRQKAERVDRRIRLNIERYDKAAREAQRPILDAHLSGKSISKQTAATVKKNMAKAKRTLETAMRAAEYRQIPVMGTSAYSKERRRRPSQPKLERMLRRAQDRALRPRPVSSKSDNRNRNSSRVTVRAIGEIKWMMSHGGERRSFHSRPLSRAVPRPASEREAARLLRRSLNPR